MSSPPNIPKRRTRSQRRRTDSDIDSYPAQEDYDWDREDTHFLPAPLYLCNGSRTPSTDTESDLDDDATSPGSKENPFLDFELLDRIPHPPAMLTQLQEVVDGLKADPIEPILEQLNRNMEVARMIGTLLDVEAALLRGDADTAERKTNSVWPIATGLDDAEYLERCNVLQGLVVKLRALQEEGGWVDEAEGNWKEVERVAEQEPEQEQRHLSGSNTASGEVLTILKEKGIAEARDWDDNYDDDGGEDYVKLQSPVSLREDEAEEMALQRYGPRSASANAQGSPSSYYTKDSREDNLDVETGVYSDSLGSSSESMVSKRLIRKRKSTLITPSTTLMYTHIHKAQRKPYTLSQSPTPGPSRPKPWTTSDVNSSADEDFYRVFWDTHSRTLLLQQPIPDWDMSWLARYESSAFTLPKTHFTFRFSLPMKYMASRIRKTAIFPRQEWEFIPSPAEWRRFCEGVTNGEELTMGFLGWERERIEDLIRERKGGEGFEHTGREGGRRWVRAKWREIRPGRSLCIHTFPIFGPYPSWVPLIFTLPNPFPFSYQRTTPGSLLKSPSSEL
ncbi:hypothetical protein AN7616.2 [Aspergillus nidulans FGSC A4]|uniref:Uncharacterized protein n=1 Tax=Emericella nidulans (strain FGSC A4 / ATCC 38163 / CBS 112.46 / NRRL 194 / M139) TaxID=227321 RepID=Q5AVR4_EMENI|nr:hypothetical protein [Aspergillus nidulans FGSC A4]EAA61802.1 hypothetical protein AN7616.2 [Aspergillus nidulans FGSC A4]CBF79749.1 TPA: conserved hypothetical protein [Aspergillus nidulans FGSC A4]|eukprot:XP_680885.1 hypothetical protein AN7616.2 [Aspergillus nidulans FGSC A4]